MGGLRNFRGGGIINSGGFTFFGRGDIFREGLAIFWGTELRFFRVGLGIFRVGLGIIREAGLTFLRERLTFFREGL